MRPDDELLLGCILHALPDLEREDDEAEGEEAACQHQPHDRLLARREQQLHVPCVALVVRRGQHDQARVGHDRLGEAARLPRRAGAARGGQPHLMRGEASSQ
eukprot:scaffold33819_cov62-Phaeocystis_antarctica.AAC.3